MVRMQMWLGHIFKLIAFCLRKLAKTLIMAYLLLKNSLNIFLLVFYKHFVPDKSI